jgi:MFS transporter, DHA2 family, multidrug resistance protein
MTPKVPNSTFVALFSILFITTFSFTLTLMGSVYIVSDLGGSTDIAIYTICFFGLGNILGIPLGRSLSHKYGTVKLLYICLHLFALSSLLAGVSTDYFEFLIFRLIQGIVSGPFYVLTGQLFAGLTPKEQKPLFTTILLTIYTNVPILGACWGGWFAYDFQWRVPFFINAAIIFFLAWVIQRALHDYQPEIEAHKFDGIGYLFYALAVFCLGFVIITGQELDWLRSSLIVTFILLGIGSLIYFLLWSRYHPYPLFNLPLLREPLFAFGMINLVLICSSYFGIVVLLALWLSIDVNYTPLWIGVLLSIMVVAGILPSILLGRKLGKIDARIPLAIALICLAISCFHTTWFNQYIDFERIAFSRILAGFGLALFLPPIFRLCFHSFAEEKLIHVMELFQVGRLLAFVGGGSLYVILWHRRKVFYHDRYGSDLTPFSEKTTQFFSDIKTFHISGQAADAQLDVFLGIQSTAFALDDCFVLMGWILTGLLVILLSTLFWKGKTFAPENRTG